VLDGRVSYARSLVVLTTIIALNGCSVQPSDSDTSRAKKDFSQCVEAVKQLRIDGSVSGVLSGGILNEAGRPIAVCRVQVRATNSYIQVEIDRGTGDAVITTTP